MDQLCRASKLWDSTLTWYTDTPDFTQCFKEIVLVWVPCVFLWIFSPLEVYFLRKSETRDIPFNYFNIIKLVLIFIGACLAFTNFFHNISTHGFQLIADLYSPIILCSTFILFFLLAIANIKRGVRSSGILFIFSFLCVVCGLPEIYSIIKFEFPNSLRNENEAKNVSYVLYYITITVIFLLNCFADEKPQRSLCLTPKNISPYKDASFLSKLFMTWFDPYIWKNYRKPVKHYLWDLDSKDKAENISLREEMRQVKGSGNMKIPPPQFNTLNTLSKEHGYTFWFCAILRAAFETMTMGLFIVTDWLISSLEVKDETWKQYFYVGLYFVVIISQSFVLTKYSEICYRLKIRVRCSAMSYLYKKALRISNAVRMEYTTSDIVNLISVDTYQLQNSIDGIHFLFALCVQIVLSYIYLGLFFGLSAVISAAFVMFILVVNYRFTLEMKRLQQEEMKNKDKRGKFLQEIFSGIKVLKMYAWELSFKKVALHLRSEENKTLKKIANNNCILQLVFQNSSFWLTFVTYLSYELITNDIIDIRTMFVSLTVFNYFRIPFHHIPQTILGLEQVLITVKRMNKFLRSEELEETSISHGSTAERLIMQNASFSWIGKEGLVMLKNLNVKINDSSLVAVVGPVGAGKSSFISAFLGEMYKISGYVNTKGSIAYVPQQAWILNASIKENITMGENIDVKLYEKAIECCALRTDLEAFPGGDLTEIGEKGVNLSGGQKQRVSLARAVCRQADIYFFDDPLSALDSHVADHVFHNVLGSNGILKDKTRILVTHNSKFFPLMDEIIVLKDGRISDYGTYQKLVDDESGEFAELARLNLNNNDQQNKEEEPNNADEKINRNSDETEGRNSNEIKTIVSSNFLQRRNENEQKSSHKIITEETMKVKRITKKTYWTYIRAGGIFPWLVIVTSLALFQTSVITSNIWLSNWVKSDDSYSTRYYYLSVYAGFGILQIALAITGVMILYKSSVKAATYFYQQLLDNVLQWPMSSFDKTPIGRIIKRFSDDIYMLDNHTAVKWGSFFTVFYRYLSIFVFMLVSIPISFLTTIPLTVMFFILRKYYVPLHHQLKRIETQQRSPLYSHLMETVSGIQSIRAFGMQNKFVQKCYRKIDSCSAAYHSSITCERWFASRIELLECLFLCSISTFVILERDRLDIGITGVIIILAVQVVRVVAYMSTVISAIEDSIISLEQINEYVAYPREPLWEKSSIQILPTWPHNGEIIFENYKLRYREGLEFVLNGLSFTMKSGEKIGIIGRTGAGKSSIIMALFRLVEPAEGKILVDGIDITNINLHQLRSKITVIPQDPILFSGTLRFNLDPFHDYDDQHLWNVLEKSHLKAFVSSLPSGLRYSIEEGGQNLSFGQRQLICLARALLRKSKILVLDEATASVDLTTDELIQKTIREEFSNCTVITIAHRLNTLQGYDKILMLEKGRIVKFDTPENVLHSGG